jgi:hypothetical protein
MAKYGISADEVQPEPERRRPNVNDWFADIFRETQRQADQETRNERARQAYANAQQQAAPTASRAAATTATPTAATRPPRPTCPLPQARRTEVTTPELSDRFLQHDLRCATRSSKCGRICLPHTTFSEGDVSTALIKYLLGMDQL